jgi:hypothetical protein
MAQFIEDGRKAGSRSLVRAVHLVLRAKRFEHNVNWTIVQMQATSVGQ